MVMSASKVGSSGAKRQCHTILLLYYYISYENLPRHQYYTHNPTVSATSEQSTARKCTLRKTNRASFSQSRTLKEQSKILTRRQFREQYLRLEQERVALLLQHHFHHKTHRFSHPTEHCIQMSSPTTKPSPDFTHYQRYNTRTSTSDTHASPLLHQSCIQSPN